jgi:decaprenylphospho-beta-D-ribofuranose 2-oxidase
MTSRFVSFRRIERRAEHLESYTGLYSTHALVLYPKNRDEVRCIFDWASARNRRVTLRAGGHSFDSQALGDDLVMSMARLTEIEPDVSNKLVRVGAGATWGEILKRLEPFGLVPAVTVTTAHATAGGTLSGDCLSRFSPAYGKEGEWIESFDIETPARGAFTCTRPADGDNPASLEERLFLGVIGGLGYLGAVVSITYRLLDVCQTRGQIGVDTKVRRRHSFRELADELVPKVRTTHEEESDPCDKDKLDSIWCAVFAEGRDRRDAIVFTSVFTSEPRRRRMGLHQPGLPLRVLVEWAMTVPPVPGLFWRLAVPLIYPDGKRFIDDLEGFTFFMDGNRMAKKVARAIGWRPKTVQQTFIVPADLSTAPARAKAGRDLVKWLEDAHRFLTELGLKPTLHDVLWMPKDFPFLLSATGRTSGFAVSYAFETSDRDVVEFAKLALAELAEVLWDEYEGRVYLVKNVCAREETLKAMYGDDAEGFFALKEEVDPSGMLRNDFLHRTFGYPDRIGSRQGITRPEGTA